MAVEDILPSVIVIGLIYLLIKWLTGSKNGAADAPIRGVTPAMVETVHTTFPHIPIPNIIYHLSKTRSTQATSETILETHHLPTPPNGFIIPPSLLPATQNPPSLPSSPSTSTTTTSTSTTNTTRSFTRYSMPAQSLIDKFGLEARIASESEIVEGAEVGIEGKEGANGAPVGGSSSWGDTKEKRERELKERKAKMVLAARQRLLAKEAEEKTKTLAPEIPKSETTI